MMLKIATASVLLLGLAGCGDGGSSAAADAGPHSQANAASMHLEPGQATLESTSRGQHDVGQQTDIPGAPSAAGRRYLRVEGSLISGNAVSVQKAGDAIMSKEFGKVMRAFEHDAETDSEARDLTGLYRRAMDEQAQGVGHISELACGLSICIGAIRTRDGEGYRAWLAKFEADKRTPSYSYGEAEVDMGQAGLETRFFFSVDPTLAGVVAPARPAAPPAS